MAATWGADDHRMATESEDLRSVTDKLNRATATFLKRDPYLLEVDANERSMTAKIAAYLQTEFRDLWDVDCEYNRDGEHLPERVYHLVHQISNDDEFGRTVYPDIIVHRRGKRVHGEHRNLLVIDGYDRPGEAERIQGRLLPL